MPRFEPDTYNSKGRQRLNRYLKGLWGTQNNLAELLNIPRMQLNHYLKGRSKPNLEAAVAIENITQEKGKKYTIYAREWLDAPEE